MNYMPQPNYNNYINTYSNPMTQPKFNNGIIWVQGIEGAKAYQLMPNANAVLMDSENEGIFYIKISDETGMSKLRTFKYEEVVEYPKQSAPDMSNYITREEFLSAINDLKNNRKGGGRNNNAEQSVSGTN